MNDERCRIQSPHGYGLACVIRQAPEAVGTVLLLHGFGSGKDSKYNRALVPLLQQHLLNSVRFDFCGHYESGGSTADLTIATAADDLISVLRDTQETLQVERLGIVASSFGASAAIRCIREITPLNAVCFRAPVSDYAATRRRQLGPTGILEWERAGLIEIDSSDGPVISPYEFYEDALSHDAYSEARAIGAPTLIIQGTNDDTVLVEESQALARAIGDHARLAIIPGADHGFKNAAHFQELVDLTVGFMTESMGTHST
jgi:pimeloyl-ACP methyl ester carboxylesterase